MLGGTIAALAAIALLTQCTRVRVMDTLERPRYNLVWPRTGDLPRVRFIANITSPDDLFVRKALFGLVDLIAGRKDLSFGIPFDIHLTPDDLLLVTDPGKGCVHFIDMRKRRYREVREMNKGELEQPIGVTADANGLVYVSDSMLGNVFVFDQRGKFVRPLFRAAGPGRPADLCYSATTGFLYIADVISHEVKVVRTDGTPVRTVGGRGTEPGRLNFPTHLWVDDDETLFVTSAMDAAINVFDGSGRFLASFGQQGDTPGYFSRPKGVAASRSGHIHVVDAIFDNFQIFDRRGSLLLAVGESGAGPGEFWLPAGIFIDARNRIFVADQQNRRVAVFQSLEVGTQ